LNPASESVENRRPRRHALKVRKPTKALPITMSDENQNKPAPALGPDIMAHIGRQLRMMYDHIIAEGVPERFAEILRKLDEPSSEGETR